MRPQPLLDGPAGEEFGGERPVRGRRTPAGRTVSRVLHDDEVALGAAADRAGRVRLDHDLLEPGEGEEESVVDGVQEALGEVGGGGVAQREDDDGVVGVGRGALGGERESQQRDMAVAAADLVAESGTVPRRVGGVLAGLGEGPADPAVPADDGGFVGDGEHGGEADAEAADRAVLVVALGGGPQGGEDSTPAASSGAPVLAATRTPSRRVSRSRPGTPALAAASAAFCASSTTSRSRYPPRTRSSSALASSRNRAGLVAQASSTPRLSRAVPNGSAPSAAGRTNLLTFTLSSSA